MSVNPLLDYRNARQRLSYNDVIDIYKGDLDLTQAADGFIVGKGVPELLYEGVPAKLDQTDYNTQPAPFGRTFTANLLTNEMLYVCADQPMEDATFFVLRTTNHPAAGKWWAIESDPQTYPDRGGRTANYTRCRVKRCADPTSVPSDLEVGYG